MDDKLSFSIRALGSFDETEIIKTRHFKRWIGDAIGWRLLKFVRTGENIDIVIEKIPRVTPWL
jgi:hypothetical protein